MPRRPVQRVAVQPSQGKKISFDEDESFEPGPSDYAAPSAGKSRNDGDEQDEDDDEDDDDAPEAVGMSAGREMEERQAAEEAMSRKARKEAAANRSRAINAKKAVPIPAPTEKRAGANEKKRRRQPEPEPELESESDELDDDEDEEVHDDDDEDEDEDARRLRKRMEAAMAEAGEEDSEEDGEDGEDDEDQFEELDEDEDEDEDEEMRSFHTESEDVGDDDEEDDEDDSETLEDEPLDDKTRTLRAKMQAMMEAAEARAAAMDGRTPPSASASISKEKTGKPTKGPNGAGITTASGGVKGGILKAQPQKPIVAAEDDGAWDLTPGIVGKPLSAKVLAAAARAEEERQAKEAVKKEEARRRKREEGERSKKRKVHKKRTEETARAVDGNKTLHLLAPTLSSTSALPPVYEPGSKSSIGANARNKFMKVAMKASGQRPGRGVVDGRKAPAARR
ncbi:hypothetical protein JCM24511_06388 [Saitozyma sp. JCM 24511]|nr:hypothetical protein JCM24511_06388 [Saitozyma sp. JCM 24511]